MSQRSAQLAARLAALGVAVDLDGSTTVQLAYTFKALLAIEQQHGSINNVLKQINGGGTGSAVDGPVFSTICDMLAAGLVYETTPDGAKWTSDLLVDYLDPTRIEQYTDALNEAFSRAFPAKVGSADPQEPGETTISPGTTGTTSAPSATDAATSSSGA